jgi:predicted nucleic acid-binding protein
MKLIISDITALIILSKTNNLYLLTNFVDLIYISNAVMKELECKDDKVKSVIQKFDFIEVKPLSSKIDKDLLESNLDRGETEAIALGADLNLIIDERSGGKFAEKKVLK